MGTVDGRTRGRHRARILTAALAAVGVTGTLSVTAALTPSTASGAVAGQHGSSTVSGKSFSSSGGSSVSTSSGTAHATSSGS